MGAVVTRDVPAGKVVVGIPAKPIRDRGKVMSDQFQVGQSASETRIVTDEVIQNIAKASQDYNPVHMNETYASTTIFGKRIAHGLFCVGMISALLANRLPGEGTILLSQEFRYKRPVYIGDRITATVVIEEIEQEKKKMRLSFTCVNQEGKIVTDGSSRVLYT